MFRICMLSIFLLSVIAGAQDIPYRILQDTCIAHLTSHGMVLYGTTPRGTLYQTDLLRSEDGARSWTTLCSMPVHADCLYVGDSIQYVAQSCRNYRNGLPVDSPVITNCDSGSSLGACRSWTISNVIVEPTLLVVSGWSDYNEILQYSLDNAQTWIDIRDSVRDTFMSGLSCTVGRTIVCSPQTASKTLFCTIDTFRTFETYDTPFLSFGVPYCVRHDGLIAALVKGSNGYDIYTSIDTARTWTLSNSISNLNFVESAAFYGDTLLIHPQTSCTLVSVADQKEWSAPRVAVKHGILIIDGVDPATNEELYLYDLMGRRFATINAFQGQTQGEHTFFRLPSNPPPILLINSNRGWSTVVNTIE